MSSRPVFIHIGAPKTGTTFLQTVMRANQAALADAGFCYPGHGNDHFLAALDVMGRTFKGHEDPRIPGSWNAVVSELMAFDGPAMISHELLSSAKPETVARVVESFPGREVHVVFTARDLARQLPAVWQERVKNQAELTFEEYFDLLGARQRTGDGRSKFWRMQDVGRVLSVWAGSVPASRIHVVTVPPKGAPRGLLLERFLGVLGVDPQTVDTGPARGNESLGAAETSVLRRLNVALERQEEKLPWPFYSREVKFFLATDVLPARRGVQRIMLSKEQHEWTCQESQRMVDEVAGAGYDVVGDLAELIPPPYPTDVPYVSPDAPDAADERDAAIDALAGLLQRFAARESEHRGVAERLGAQAKRGTLTGRVVGRVARTGWAARARGRH